MIVLGVREREEWWTGVLKKSVRFFFSFHDLFCLFWRSSGSCPDRIHEMS